MERGSLNRHRTRLAGHGTSQSNWSSPAQMALQPVLGSHASHSHTGRCWLLPADLSEPSPCLAQLTKDTLPLASLLELGLRAPGPSSPITFPQAPGNHFSAVVLGGRRSTGHEPWSCPCLCSPHNLMHLPSPPASVPRAGLAPPALCSKPAAKRSHTDDRLRARHLLPPTRSLPPSLIFSLTSSPFPSLPSFMPSFLSLFYLTLFSFPFNFIIPSLPFSIPFPLFLFPTH